MEKITISNINEYVINGTWSVDGSMKPEGETDKALSKRFLLNVKFDNTPVIDVITKALEPTKIQWVNNVGRPDIDTYKNGQTIDISFTSPGKRPVVDPRTATINELRKLSTDAEREQYLRDMMKEASGK